MKNKLLSLIFAMMIFVCSGCGRTVSYDSFKKEISKYYEMLTEEKCVNYFETNKISIGEEVITQNSKLQYRNDEVFLQRFNHDDQYPYIYHHEDMYFGISELHYNGEYVEIEKSLDENVQTMKLSKGELFSLGSDRKAVIKDNKYIINLNYSQLTSNEKVVISRSFDDAKVSNSSYSINEMELTYVLLDNSVEYTLSFDFIDLKNENNRISYYSERKISFGEFEKFSYEYFAYEDNFGGAEILNETRRKTNFENPFVIHKFKGYFYGYFKKNLYRLMEEGTIPTSSSSKVYLLDENKKGINNLLAKKFNHIGFNKWDNVINIEKDGYYYVHISSSKDFEGYFESISFEIFPEDKIETIKTTSGTLSFAYDHKIFTNELNADKVYIITNTSNKSIFINQVEVKAGDAIKYHLNGQSLVYFILEYNSILESDYPYEYSIDVYSYDVNYNAVYEPEEITSEFSTKTYHTIHALHGGVHFTFKSTKEGKYKIEFEYINKFGEIDYITYYDSELVGSGIITPNRVGEDYYLHLIANKTYNLTISSNSSYEYVEFKVRIIFVE